MSIRNILDKVQNDCQTLSFSEQRKAKKTILEAMSKLCIVGNSENNDDEEKSRILSGGNGTGFDAKALQNRDRSRASYVAQMNKIAQNPDYDMISTSKTPETGAPMVFSRNTVIPSSQAGNKEVITMADGKGGKEKITAVYAVIEADELQASHNADGSKNEAYGGDSGVMALNNGRSAGVKQAYKLGNADQYKSQLMADKSHGISADKISKMKNPVLVRVFSENDVAHIENIGTASNVSMGAELSASEQANSDASRLSDSSVSVYKGGDIASLVNRDFVRGFVSDMGGTEAVGAMIAKDGSVTAQGVKRIENALVAKAYSDDSILTDITESTDSELRSLGDALKDVAGRWSVMRSFAKDGAIAKNMDITSNLTEALQLVMKSRREGIKIGELLAQNDVFSGSVNPITESLVRLMFNDGGNGRIRSSDTIKRALHGFIDQAMNSSEGADMFGDTASPEPLIAQQQDNLDQEDNMKKSQVSMFDSVVANYFTSFVFDGVGKNVGEYPYLFDIPPLTVIEIEKSELPKKDIAKLADEILHKIQLSGKKLINKHTGWELVISQKDRKKMGDNDELTRIDSNIVLEIEKVIANAILVETHYDKKINKSVDFIHRLYAPVIIDNVIYRAKLTVQDYASQFGRKNLHAIESLEIEDAPMGTLPTNELTSSDQPTSERKIRVADFLKGVKLDDGSDLQGTKVFSVINDTFDTFYEQRAYKKHLRQQLK